MSVPKTARTRVVGVADISRAILVLRGHKVLLDAALAALYGVSAKRFNEQVRRNRNRFPDDFMFQLTPEESRALRSQSATLKSGRGQHRKYLPYAFTEQGVAMLSSVLNSERAIQVNIAIMRTFVRLRKFLATHKDLAAKLEAMWCSSKSRRTMFSLACLMISASKSLSRRSSGRSSSIFISILLLNVRGGPGILREL